MLAIFSRALLVKKPLLNISFQRQARLIFPSMATFSTSSSPTTSSNPSTKRVGTHNGSFHCDEALGCFMIRLTHKFSSAQIVRTRDSQVLEKLDAVLDVGGVYDPIRTVMIITKKSLMRLLVMHLGKEIIAKELGVDEEHPGVQRLFLAIYKSFMEAIDAIDNGINQYDTNQPPKYVNNTHLSSRVGRLNLDWIDPDQSSEKENEAFESAMLLAGSEFLDSVCFHVRSWLPARSLVMECLAERQDINQSGEIKVLKRFCPDDRSKSWRVQAVSISPDIFESWKPLPTQWRGLRDDELSKLTGIPGCIFVHMSGFIGGNQSYEGALTMAKAALKL
ncbi:hypothetical protein ACH5RR_041813 [Cinchona calisaya]|uniref:Metal-dependent protein hydrolase n=1 Tax=Cinchona calisaya TaxID=153742 RepID=A0ABD2XWD4_9GENT